MASAVEGIRGTPSRFTGEVKVAAVILRVKGIEVRKGGSGYGVRAADPWP